MTEILQYLKAALTRLDRLDPPALEALDPVIRSGDQFLLRDPLAGEAAGSTPGESAKLRLDKGAIGSLVVEWGYDVPQEKLVDFMTWLQVNEPALLDHNAAGGVNVRYRGTYAVFSSSEKGSGQFRTIWSYRVFSDLDELSNEFVRRTSFANLVAQLRSFFDTRPGASRSQQIYLLASSAQLTTAV